MSAAYVCERHGEDAPFATETFFCIHRCHKISSERYLTMCSKTSTHYRRLSIWHARKAKEMLLGLPPPHDSGKFIIQLSSMDSMA